MCRTFYWGLYFLLFVLAAQAASAHVMNQIFSDFRQSEKTWSLEILFDAGYATPKGRDDPEAPQPTRKWLMDQNEERWQIMRAGAETYLAELLHLTWNDHPIQLSPEFPNFKSTPPTFPELLNGGAYFHVIYKGTIPEEAGILRLKFDEIGTGSFIINLLSDQDREYLTLAPGVEGELLYRKATGETQQARGRSLITFGFRHVLPLGWDHILFILGIFLLGRNWQSLLQKSLLFTLAHSITLGLVWLQLVPKVPSFIEVLIALSIAILGAAVLWKKINTVHHTIVIFSFGLIHGLGFGNAIADKIDRGNSPIISLLKINFGIELAQIFILLACFLLTIGWFQSRFYTRITRPLLGLALLIVGLFLAIQRL